jgi:hypothetical protein
VCRDTRVPGCASDCFTLFVGDVISGLSISKTLCQSEVNNVAQPIFIALTHEEVVGFDVSVKKVGRMQSLHPRDELVCEHASGL